MVHSLHLLIHSVIIIYMAIDLTTIDISVSCITSIKVEIMTYTLTLSIVNYIKSRVHNIKKGESMQLSILPW